MKKTVSRRVRNVPSGPWAHGVTQRLHAHCEELQELDRKLSALGRNFVELTKAYFADLRERGKNPRITDEFGKEIVV